MHGQWKLVTDYRQETNGVRHALNWTEESINAQKNLFLTGSPLDGSYGRSMTIYSVILCLA